MQIFIMIIIGVFSFLYLYASSARLVLLSSELVLCVYIILGTNSCFILISCKKKKSVIKNELQNLHSSAVEPVVLLLKCVID